MKLFQSQQRLLPTIFTAVMLVVAYFAYSHVTSPYLDVPQDKLTVSRSPSTASQPLSSPDFQSLAARWLPEDHWVRSAGKRFRDQQRYLYFNEFDLENDNHSMIVTPIAMLWTGDSEEEPPLTVTAASAQLDRSSAFKLEEGEFGKITSGSLFGDVRIRGPNGLRIDGRNFHVSEKDMKMWSNQRVTFAWENHTGHAENGVEIKLLASADSESGLVSVSDIQSVTLLGRVICNLRLPQGTGRPDIPILINAANGFEYFVPTRTARFSGYQDRELTPQNHIVVQRTTDTGGLDKLFCSQLTLYFQPKIDDHGSEGQLDLQRIDAEGTRVVFYSPDNDVTAWMTNLRYIVPQRTLQLWDSKPSTEEQPSAVRIIQRGSDLLAPRISVLHDDRGGIRSVECRGAGSLTHKDDRPGQSLTARWQRSFEYRNGEVPHVVLTGKARAEQPSTAMYLSAETIDVALRRPETTEGVGSSVSDMTTAPVDLSDLRPESLNAYEDIHLSSPQMSGTIVQRLTVKFQEAAEDSPQAIPGASADAHSQNGTRTVSLTDAAEVGSGFTTFDANSLDAVLEVQTEDGSSPSRLTDVWLKGAVDVRHSAEDPEQSFRALGNVAYAAAGFEGQREIQLFGDPATVINTDRRIEGQRIDLHEKTREATVEGSGRLRLVVDQGLNGRPLERPSPLDIYWGRQMVFTGRTARFVGDIRAVMEDDLNHFLEIRCEGMTVQFTEDLLLQNSESPGSTPSFAASSGGGTEIESISCESLVTVHADQMVNGVLESTHEAEFSDFHVNLISGDFHASGPGWIESTQPDRDNQLQVAPEVTAQANRPARTRENNFVYVKASFIGSLSGNVDDQVARLKNHVTGVFGPVRRLGDRLVLDSIDTSHLPDQAGILRCEEMTVSVIPGITAEQDSFSLTASTNARLESKRFSGDADRITYDHSKQQFILKAEGDMLATVYHRPGQSGKVNNLVGKRFEYYPGRNQLTANQITGVRAAQ